MHICNGTHKDQSFSAYLDEVSDGASEPKRRLDATVLTDDSGIKIFCFFVQNYMQPTLNRSLLFEMRPFRAI